MNHSDFAFDLLHRLEAGLPTPAREALHACERIAEARGLPLYIVGGAVRDLILRRDGYDLDLAVEGEVESLARELAGATGGHAVVHDRFGTATVKGRGFAIDLARTRRETYAHPGALPYVEPATLSEDLARRDFTINAIAMRLSPPAEVVDPYRGVEDVRSSLVRVLHERSFQDDATRMLRAVRYAARLDFKIARQTEVLIQRDLPYLKHISGPRLRRELALLFGEPSAVDGTLAARRLGILAAIHPALGLAEPVAARWHDVTTANRTTGQLGKGSIALDELGFCVVAAPKDGGTAASVTHWLHLTGRVEKALQDVVRLRAVSPKLTRASPSQVVETLDLFAPAAVQALGVIEGGEVAATCDAYLRTWRHVRPVLDGDSLIAMGMPEGQVLGDTLRRLRHDRLEGRIATREQEIELVRRAIDVAEGSGER